MYFLEILLLIFLGCVDIFRDCVLLVVNDKDFCKNNEMKENCFELCNLCGKSGNVKINWLFNDVIFL